MGLSVNQSITRQLTVSLVATVLVVSAIAVTAMYVVLSRDSADALERKANETIAYLVGTLEVPLWSFDDNAVKTIAAAVSNDESIVRLTIKGESGSVIYSREKQQGGELTNRSAHIFHKEGNREELAGEVSVSLTKEIQKARNRQLLFFSTLIIFVILISVAMVTVVSIRTSLSKPLTSLNEIANRFALGKYDTTGQTLPYVEFLPFGRALAEMAKKIEGQIRTIQQAEAKYRDIFENALEGIFQTTVEGRFLNGNPALAGILGYRSSEELLSSVSDIASALHIDHEQRDKLLSLLLERAIVNGYEVQLRRKDGRAIWVSISARLVRDETGTPRFIDGLLADITERKQAEDTLRLSSERLQLATRVASIGIWDWDIPRNELLWDDSMYQLYGIQKGDFGGAYDAWIRTVHPEDKAHTDGEIQAALRGEREYAPEFRIVRPDGSVRFIKADSQTFKDRDGKPLRMIGTNIDITERKQAEEELKRYRDSLEETVERRTAELRLARDAAEAANKAKSGFLANMSHELRTPLNAILGFSRILRRDPQLTGAQIENLDIINRSGEHLLALINDVLEMAKIEAGRAQLEVASFDLGGMIRDVTDMMRLRAEQKGLSLQLDQDSEFPRFIRGDEARLRQILVNLVGNAVKFTHTGGITLRLGVKQNDHQHLLIEVEDTGPGISVEDQERIFKPFVQLAEGAEQKGTGLGLTITKQFVDLMGGRIAVESTLGRGSLFRVDVPVELADFSSSHPLEQRDVVGLAPGQPAYRILITEDQRENQLLLSRLMGAIGLEATVAENGEQCVRLFQEWHPDLIWMDRRMPVMDGMEAARLIRRLPDGDKVKIVAVTASAFKEQQQEMLDAGMDGFVTKPYRFGEIYECLARQLGLKYVYRAEAFEKRASPITLTAVVLPTALRLELQDALVRLDSERIAALIGQIGEVHRELGDTLSRLAKGFDYAAMLRLLDEVGGTGR